MCKVNNSWVALGVIYTMKNSELTTTLDVHYQVNEPMA